MRSVVLFTATYTVGLFFYGQTVDSELTILYTSINIGLFVLFGILNIWARWPIYTLWGISLVGLFNMLGGVLLVDGEALYLAEVIGPIRYDKVFHTAAGAAFIPLAWEAAKRWSGPDRHRGGMLLFTWLVVMGGGAVVEIAELIGTELSEVNVGDYANNALDLVANALGATVGVFLILWWEHRGQPS